MRTRKFFGMLSAGFLLATLRSGVPADALAAEGVRWGSAGFGSTLIVFPDTDPGGVSTAEIAVGTHRDRDYGLVFFGHQLSWPPTCLGRMGAPCFLFFTQVEVGIEGGLYAVHGDRVFTLGPTAAVGAVFASRHPMPAFVAGLNFSVIDSRGEPPADRISWEPRVRVWVETRWPEHSYFSFELQLTVGPVLPVRGQSPATPDPRTSLDFGFHSPDCGCC